MKPEDYFIIALPAPNFLLCGVLKVLKLIITLITLPLKHIASKNATPVLGLRLKRLSSEFSTTDWHSFLL